MKEPDRYVITTVADLLEIPADRHEAMLVDLGAWLSFMSDIKDKLPEGVKVPQPLTFSWIDDGKNDMNVRLTFKEPA